MQMNRKRLWPAIVLLLLVALLIAGCGGQQTSDTVEGLVTGTVEAVARYMPQINLPRITLTYDESGIPTVFGIRTSSIERVLPLSLDFLELSPDAVQTLMARNVQHVELNVNDAGLFVYVNGKALPYVAWDESRLALAGDLLDRLDMVQYDTTIAKALPLLGRVGVDVVAIFPVPSGETQIPLRDRSQRVLAEPQPVNGEQAVIQAVIEYSEDGVPSVASITSREIGQLLGTDLSSVELPQSNLTLVRTAGIREAAVVTQTDGLHLLVNGRDLLHLAYNEQHLVNAIDLYAQISDDEQGEVIATFLHNVEPILYRADIDLVVQLPEGG